MQDRLGKSCRWFVAATIVFVSCGLNFDRQSEGSETQQPLTDGELAHNAGFEKAGSPAPEGWMRDMDNTGQKGNVVWDQNRFHSGAASLRLEPNRQNAGHHPLAIAQVIPAARLRGRKVEFSAYVRAEGGATAVVGMLNFVQGNPSNLVTIDQPPGGSGWVRKSGIYDVPDDASVQLVVTCHVTGQSGAAWFDDVSVVEVNGEPAAAVATPSDSTLPATVRVDASSVIREIPRTLYGTNAEWRWSGNLLWQEKQGRLDPEVVRLTRDLGVSLIRYPGGILSDVYDWKKGIGPHGERPVVLHETGRDERSRPNLGTDEALDFARQTNGELLITVNAGTGTPGMAADWVRYVNGDGRRVHYWEIGNELYIKEGSRMFESTTVTPATYADRYLKFAKAMREADPGIKLGAIGGENRGRYTSVGYANWTQTVLEKAGDQIDFLAVHNAYAPLVGSETDIEDIYRAMFAAPVLIARNLENISRQIVRYAPKRASDIAIAVTEWGPVFQWDFRGRFVDHPKTLGSALFTASTLKAFIESPRTEIANFWLLNDVSVLGSIGSLSGNTTPIWAPTAKYHAIRMYTQYFGDRLVSSEATGPTFDSKAVGQMDAVKDVPYLDIVSSLSRDGQRLYVMAINKHFDRDIEASISLRGFNPVPVATAWTLNGTGIDAHGGTRALEGLPLGKQAEVPGSRRFNKGGPAEITFDSSSVDGIGAQFSYRFPAHSVTSLVLTRR